jgi:nucleotide-binding universal stress UspA family protein
MFNRILVPTDFSRASDAALAHARMLAGSTGATVHVLHIVDPPRRESSRQGVDLPDPSVARPSRRSIAKASALAFGVAMVVLVTAVLSAEYGIDPFGTGVRGSRPASPALHLDHVHSSAERFRSSSPALHARTRTSPVVYVANGVSLMTPYCGP